MQLRATINPGTRPNAVLHNSSEVPILFSETTTTMTETETIER